MKNCYYLVGPGRCRCQTAMLNREGLRKRSGKCPTVCKS